MSTYNGLMSALVFVAGAVGACLAVVRILRREDRSDRHLRLGGVAVGGALTAIVGLRAGAIPFLVVVVLVGLAVLAGVWFRPQLIRWRGMPSRSSVVPLGPNPFELVALAVVMTVLVWPDPRPPTAEERDSTRYGLKINRHADRVTSRVLDRTPTVGDASRSRCCSPRAAPASRSSCWSRRTSGSPPARRRAHPPAASRTGPTSSPGIPRSASQYPNR